MLLRPHRSTPFPYTTLFRSTHAAQVDRINNWAGRVGAWTSDILLLLFGLSAYWWVVLLARHISANYRRITRSEAADEDAPRDRKSTRLNSSHPSISYAVFCLNAPASPPLYPLSLHDALPIYPRGAGGPHQQLGRARRRLDVRHPAPAVRAVRLLVGRAARPPHFRELPPHHAQRGGRRGRAARSEEHTSELQSPVHLVCRLLPECSCVPTALPPFPTRRSSDLPTRRRWTASTTGPGASAPGRPTSCSCCSGCPPTGGSCCSPATFPRTTAASRAARRPTRTRREIGRAHV